MSEARERVRYALSKHGLSLTRGELDGVMRAFEEPKRKAAAKPVADKPAAEPKSYGTGKHQDKPGPKSVAKSAEKSYGTGKKPHDKQGS